VQPGCLLGVLELFGERALNHVQRHGRMLPLAQSCARPRRLSPVCLGSGCAHPFSLADSETKTTAAAGAVDQPPRVDTNVRDADACDGVVPSFEGVGPPRGWHAHRRERRQRHGVVQPRWGRRGGCGQDRRRHGRRARGLGARRLWSRDRGGVITQLEAQLQADEQQGIGLVPLGGYDLVPGLPGNSFTSGATAIVDSGGSEWDGDTLTGSLNPIGISPATVIDEPSLPALTTLNLGSIATVGQGDLISLAGGGYQPNAVAAFSIGSTPTRLAVTKASTGGVVSATPRFRTRSTNRRVSH
jgi:hypothetical protein